jgi:adenosylcobyric acid synthase
MTQRAKAVMVLGTTSGAGKSWLTTALCRYYARQGLRVAPFKAQNMSNNARVVEGGEIGSAQYFQALTACVVPDVRMNPLLLKPERDTHSQVVFLGQVDQDLTRMDWRGRSALVWPRIQATLDTLMSECDVVVIEGAGSPAEINLSSSDIVNMRVAEHAQAACLLVSDIDRGGSFAHLYGTWALLPETQRRLIQGFVLNKFRGDPTLLEPGPRMLRLLSMPPKVALYLAFVGACKCWEKRCLTHTVLTVTLPAWVCCLWSRCLKKPKPSRPPPLPLRTIWLHLGRLCKV